MYIWNRRHPTESPLRRFPATGSSAIIFHSSLTGCYPWQQMTGNSFNANIVSNNKTGPLFLELFVDANTALSFQKAG